MLQGIFLTQRRNLHLLRLLHLIGRQILYHCATWEAPSNSIEPLNKQDTCKLSMKKEWIQVLLSLNLS